MCCESGDCLAATCPQLQLLDLHPPNLPGTLALNTYTSIFQRQAKERRIVLSDHNISQDNSNRRAVAPVLLLCVRISRLSAGKE